MKKYLEILEITKPHGIRGEMRAKYYCDSAEELTEYKTLYLGNDKQPVTLASCRFSKNVAVIKLSGVDTPEQAARYTGEIFYIDRDDAELGENVWFVQDIIGLEVFDADSRERYGIVEDILQNAPADVYVIKTDGGRQLLFPSIPEVLLDVNLSERKIIIRPLEGLFDI